MASRVSRKRFARWFAPRTIRCATTTRSSSSTVRSRLRWTRAGGLPSRCAAREPAAQAWFGPFNSSHATVEWRALDGKPFAIIQRWRLDDNADEDKNGRPTAKPMLVVTRLPPGPVCHVAHVDVKANPDANELARKAADEFARGFKCGKDEIKVIGNSGRAVKLAVRR